MCACNITKNFIRVYPRCFKLSPGHPRVVYANTRPRSPRLVVIRNRYNFGEFNSPTHVRKNVPRVSEVIGSVLTSNVGNIPVCRTTVPKLANPPKLYRFRYLPMRAFKKTVANSCVELTLHATWNELSNRLFAMTHKIENWRTAASGAISRILSKKIAIRIDENELTRKKLICWLPSYIFGKRIPDANLNHAR